MSGRANPLSGNEFETSLHPQGFPGRPNQP